MATLADIQKVIKDNNIRRVDLIVTDLVGRWHHLSIPATRLDKSVVERGQGFDGSSLRGFQSVEESDMLLRPDLDTAQIDPTESEPTLKLICNVHDPMTGERYLRDPRYVATKAEKYLADSGIADKAFFGPEIEFFIFDSVEFSLATNSSSHSVSASEAAWGSDRDGDSEATGYLIPRNQGYTPVAPFDKLSDMRWEIAEKLEQVGVKVETHHHEVASGGQGELATKFNTLRVKADESQWYKHIVRNVANGHGKFATFMPKPVFDENGTGMHVHQSLFLDGKPLFYDENGYAKLSETARHYIGGLLHHGPSLLAFCAPSTNSYKRLVPGFESPIFLEYSQRNRSAAVRIPTYEVTPASKRVEFRPPDPSANIYLALSAMLMAGLDGIRKKIDPGDPVDENIYDLPPEEAARLSAVPTSMEEAVEALGNDHDYLLHGSVFTQDVIDHYISLKEQEARDVFLHPVPAEFVHYFHI
ncbi:MAG: type I glutamate--ammonia ligase [Actinomycetia bacterium]|nr:type I glutamate--ammonia ligase [Actinomycetes bacterium]